jgi:hypothetical protein
MRRSGAQNGNLSTPGYNRAVSASRRGRDGDQEQEPQLRVLRFSISGQMCKYFGLGRSGASQGRLQPVPSAKPQHPQLFEEIPKLSQVYASGLGRVMLC